MREPKIDSTKGHSVINPLNYKGDVLVQVWIDSRVLATLSNWLDRNDTYTMHMSQVVRRPLEVLTELLVKEGEVEMVDSTGEARKLLERRYRVDLNRGGRGTKNVMHNVELTVRREELTERMQRGRVVDDAGMPLREQKSVLAEEAIKKYKELYGGD